MSDTPQNCTYCGAAIQFAPHSTTVICCHCGREAYRDKADDPFRDLLNAANDERFHGHFRIAETHYQSIIAQDATVHEAHWGLLLCHYGVVYQRDPVKNREIITCLRKNTASASSSDELKHAKLCAPTPAICHQYVADAAYIDSVQRAIQTLERTRKRYDIFLCYKETEFDPQTQETRRTQDSDTAHDLYDFLTQAGYRVFYARKTLNDLIGVNYEAAIYHALQTSRVMLVLGSRAEYFQSTWVKSEWTRFMDGMDPKKAIFPLYKNFPPADLPPEFEQHKLQAIDMSRVGFEHILLTNLKRQCPPYRSRLALKICACLAVLLLTVTALILTGDPAHTPQPTPTPTVAVTLPPAVKGYARITKDREFFRTSASTSGEIKSELTAGTIVEIRSQEHTATAAWHIVVLNGVWGYIPYTSAELVTPEEAAACFAQPSDSTVPDDSTAPNITPTDTVTSTPTPTPTPVPAILLGYARLVTGAEPLYSIPGRPDSALTHLKTGDVVYIYRQDYTSNAAWHYVLFETNLGYLPYDSVELLTPDEVDAYLATPTPVPTPTPTSSPTPTLEPTDTPAPTPAILTWTNPVRTLKSSPAGTDLTAADLSQVLQVRDVNEGTFRLTAPFDGDYIFYVDASMIRSNYFQIHVTRNDTAMSPLTFYKQEGIQAGTIRNVRKGDVLVWENCGDVFRGYTLTNSPFEMMLTVQQPGDLPLSLDVPMATATTWDEPVKVLRSSQAGAEIAATDLDKVLLIDGSDGGTFRMTAPYTGDYTFRVDASMLRQESFQLCLIIDSRIPQGSTVHRKTFHQRPGLQSFTLNNIQEGALLTFWNYGDVPRRYPLTDSPFEMMISVARASSTPTPTRAPTAEPPTPTPTANPKASPNSRVSPLL